MTCAADGQKLSKPFYYGDDDGLKKRQCDEVELMNYLTALLLVLLFFDLYIMA